MAAGKNHQSKFTDTLNFFWPYSNYYVKRQSCWGSYLTCKTNGYDKLANVGHILHF